jgi:D-alanine-D-alanine ligase
MTKIGVLMGGLSAEREVSLNTGKGVLAALLEKGHDAVGIDWTPELDLVASLRGVGKVWLALHGTYGEDGCVQGLLEILKIPYTGSGVLASALAMDKVLSKEVFLRRGVPTPEYTVLGPEADPVAVTRPFGFPVVVKPSREGSTVGVTIVKGPGELAAAVELSRRCHGETMVEHFVPGRELSVGVLDGEVLGTVEIRTNAAFYDYEAKYKTATNEYLVPAPVPAGVDQSINAAALSAYRALGCTGHARVDVRLDPQDRPWVLEVNTLPGMTGTSLLPKIAKHRGMDYAALVDRILRLARLHS